MSKGVICGPLRFLTSLLLLGNQLLPIIFIAPTQTVSKSMRVDTTLETDAMSPKAS